MSSNITSHCITVINEIFSIDQSINFLDALCKVEEKAVRHEYGHFESFAADVVPLLRQQTTIRQQSQHPDVRIPEEYCDKAIYNYYQFDSNSTLYALNISLHPLNQPLLQSLNKKEFTTLPRIYITKNRHLLKEVQENVNGVLALFSDMSKRPLDPDENGNPRLVFLTGNVTIVHPLGDYYHMNSGSTLDGWIKVKIVKSSRIKSVLPEHFLNDFIFGNNNNEAAGTVKKIIMPLQQKGTDLATARDNEIIHRFISKVTASCTNTIQLYPTPIQYLDSLIPLSNSLSTPNSENERHSKSSIEASWIKLEQFCAEKFAKVVDIEKYSGLINQPFDERGHFKRVFFVNDEKTVQLFYKCTTTQKVTELASYLALKNTDCIGNMMEMVVENKQAVGLTMDKYDMTLHHYINKQKNNLSGERKYELIQQMWKSIVTIHRRGIAHRDLSAHNFMIKLDRRHHKSEKEEKDEEEVKLFLIDFGKAIFFRQRDAQHWWVDSSECDVYQDELRPIHPEELSIWCKSLPYIMSKPDHGHRLFRSIQTLPKNSNDHMTLPYLIDPVAEDVYSLGVMTWNLFSGKLPWPGVFDSDLKQIRATVTSLAEIDRLIRKEVPGTLSKYLLSCCLRPNPLERHTAEQILEWLDRPSNKRNIISEWDLYYSNTGRHRR